MVHVWDYSQSNQERITVQYQQAGVWVDIPDKYYLVNYLTHRFTLDFCVNALSVDLGINQFTTPIRIVWNPPKEEKSLVS